MNHNFHNHIIELEDLGFSIIDQIYTNEEIDELIKIIDQIDTSKDTFRKSTDLFAIRQFFKEIPQALNVLMNQNLKLLLEKQFGERYFIVKSIYFDKPETSNWYVSYHQDLTISVSDKVSIEGFGPWTVKQNQFAVQPPVEFLENIFTIRIHLDETNESNGALKVIPRSHLKKIYRPETIDWSVEKEVYCNVPKGGVMLMKPLTLHGSNRTTNNKRRRVIHVEFSNLELPQELNWAERINF